jgi:uncharacterized membrane protein
MHGFGGGVLVAATVTAGVMAGLYAAFFFAVMPGLKRIDDAAFAAAMRAINVAIINGWFAVCFVGTPVLAALAAVLHLGAHDRDALPWIIAGLVLYLATMGVTGVVNVPLNNALAASGDDVQAARSAFEARWVRFNTIRAGLGTAALACLCVALLMR